VSRLAAVVLNYRTPDDTAAAVAALRASARPVDDLLVVDNGSGDDSARRLGTLPAPVTLLEAGANLGFSGGSNLGIRAALARGADRVLLVNGDARPTPPCVGRLEAALAAEPAAGVAGPVLVAADDPGRVTSAGIAFSPRTGRMLNEGHGRPLAEVAGQAPVVVDAVSGAVMLLARQTLERVGLLDEAYFFSFEDLDLCLRARRAGLLTLSVRDALALHAGGRSIGPRSPRRLYFAARNHLRLAARQAPAGPLGGALRGGSILALNLAHALVRDGAPRAAGLRAVLRGAWDHARGRYGDDPAA
jgi:GT2 family glycosyltransferase